MVTGPDRRLTVAKPRRRDVSGFGPRDLHPSAAPIRPPSESFEIDDAVDQYASLLPTVIDLTDPAQREIEMPRRDSADDATGRNEHVVSVRLIAPNGDEVL